MTRDEAVGKIKEFWTKKGKELPACRYSEYTFILLNLPELPTYILDAGVGASLLPAFLSSLGHSVVAADLWDEQNKSTEGSIGGAFRIREICGYPYEINQVDLSCLPYCDKRFGITICNSTIEHIPEDNDQDIRVVKELLRVSNKLVFFTFPVENVPKPSMEPNKPGDHPAARIYSFNTAIQRLVLPSISSGFEVVLAENMVDDGKLLVRRIIRQ
jgi:SAM-dependent methyltransferase